MSLNQLLLLEIIGKPVLYHYTAFLYAPNIVKEDSLKISYVEDALSLTRNAQLERFGTVRFTLDATKLKSKYSIQPFMYGDSKAPIIIRRDNFGDEREERMTKNVTNLHKYLVQIDIIDSMSQKLTQDTYNTIKEHIQSKGWNVPVNIVSKWEPVKI